MWMLWAVDGKKRSGSLFSSSVAQKRYRSGTAVAQKEAVTGYVVVVRL